MTDKNAVTKIEQFQKFGSILVLDRIGELLKRLGDPQEKVKCIHVAGTNGKGSVCRFIYSVLRAHNYSVGLYTSPFLTVFNERIELDGQMISDEDLAELTEEVLGVVKEMTDEGYDSPTEFDVVTAISFLYFARKKCDFVVLEVGLGGRGDSTNIISSPLLSVITGIAYDHTDRLGDTLEKIAYEKAGIIKSKRPVVSSAADEGAKRVIAREAYEKESVLFDTTKLTPRVQRTGRDGTVFNVRIRDKEYTDIEISMLGSYQVQNAVTALAALDTLRDIREISLDKEKLLEGMKNASNIGRFEIMKRDPYLVLDGAHNPDGAEALLDAMKTYFPDESVTMVLGILKDKDVAKMLDSFMAVPGLKKVIVTEPVSDRKMEAGELAELIRARGVEATPEPDFSKALPLAEEEKTDVILCAGSLYLIGALRGRV